MIRYFGRLSILTLFLWGCFRQEIPEPSRVLEDSVLVNVLVDGYILNAAFNYTYGNPKDSVSWAYNEQLMNKYGINKTILDENIRWIQRDPNRMDSVYQMMLDRINDLEDQVNNIEEQ